MRICTKLQIAAILVAVTASCLLPAVSRADDSPTLRIGLLPGEAAQTVIRLNEPLRADLERRLRMPVDSAVVALVLAIFVARNLSPIAAISALLRCAFNLFRSLPELVLGLVLVATVGFGPLAGIVALSLHSIGMLGKFFAELIEHADLAPIEALRAQGASRGQSFCFGVLPQILPRVVDLTLYRWEHNLRASAVMGLVGAGGIGFELISALRLFEYREGLALLILTFFLVTVIDFAGGMLRTRFVED
jgi:phosphonate transport system permease protein